MSIVFRLIVVGSLLTAAPAGAGAGMSMIFPDGGSAIDTAPLPAGPGRPLDEPSMSAAPTGPCGSSGFSEFAKPTPGCGFNDLALPNLGIFLCGQTVDCQEV